MPEESRNEDRFNGATSFQKWIGSIGTIRRLIKVSFNGATSFQKWIEDLSDHFVTEEEAVSMEPLLFRNG